MSPDVRVRRRVLVPAIIASTPPPLGARVHELAGRTMGTTWNVRLVGGRELDVATLRPAIESALDAVVAQMSTWEPASDLCRFNAAPAGTRHALPPLLREVVDAALQVAADSGGAFDPTAGALVDAWGFGPVARTGVPAAPALASARARGGWRRLAPRADGVLQPGGLALDLSAIAKGFGVDLVARRLSALGVESHLVEVGGELRGTGLKPDGQPWWVRLEEPDAGATGATLLALHGLAVATSGDYRRWFEHAGVRYSHTIDPRDGLPIRHGLASVSVIHPECMQADAWSTALTVLGPEAGLALAQQRGLAARFVLRQGAGFEERTSAAFDRLLQ